MSETVLALEAFGEWLVAEGGSVLAPTNEWEVLRYKTAQNLVGVIYRNKKGQHSFSPQARIDYPAFIKAVGLAPTERVKRFLGEKNARLKAQLLERDGPACCYCNQFAEKLTLEHFHAIARHGSNHPDNCALACESCNKLAGSLPVIEKLKLRDRIREAVAKSLPWEFFDTATLAHEQTP